MSRTQKITGANALKRIVYQGEPGANSHLACSQAYPDYAPIGMPTFEDAFDEVEAARAELAMIPIENSVAGRVSDIHHLMRGSRLNIIAEHFLPVRHHLLAPKGASLKTIRFVESHVQALGQCHKFLRKHHFAQIAAADTAGSAREVAKSANKARAAIASPLAAKIYDLKIVVPDIQDVMFNTTRFIVLARDGKWASRSRGPMLTTVLFQVRNVPGALFKALGGFATNSVNMTKLESYMTDGSFMATEFYVDVEGHPEEPSLARALDELKFFSERVSILGVYKAHRLRKKVRDKRKLMAAYRANM
jgi:prephenate dehydratase